MAGKEAHDRWLYTGVACVTCGSLVLELALTRIFSVVMYYHFAFMAISLALFGLGFAGVFLYLRPGSTEEDRFFRGIRRSSLLAALTTIGAIAFILRQKISLTVAVDNLWALGATYLAASVPFFFAGLSVSAVVKRERRNMGRLYFYDLLGAALGCLLLLVLLNSIGGVSTVIFAAALFALAYALFTHADPAGAPLVRRAVSLIVVVLCLALAVGNMKWPLLRIPSVKGTVEENVIFSKWNSFSRVTVERSSSDHLWLKMDSSAATRIFSGEVAKQAFEPTRRFTETRVASTVYALRKPGKALVIGPGGGADVIAALYFGQKQVTGVELNPIIVNDVMKGQFLDYSGQLYLRPDVRIVVNEGRSFIRSSNERYDSIQATLVDTWAATAAGAFTLSENNLYTKEAFIEYLKHLTPHGIVTMTRWKDDPPREFLRLLAIGRAALDAVGVSDHAPHFYVASDSRMATLLLKASPFTREEVKTLDDYLASAGLQRVFSPFQPDTSTYDDFLRNKDWKSFVKSYPVDISPPTDDRPFFFYTVRPESMLLIFRDVKALTEHNLGLLLLLILLGVVGVLVLVFLVFPLFLARRDVLRGRLGLKLRYLLYFICLGVGFITVEIALMQKFVLFLGHPVYALVVILFSLLVASGVGSLLCRKVTVPQVPRVVVRNLCLFAGLLVLYLLYLTPIFNALAALPLMVRAIITVACVAPLGLVMGSFLPLGVVAGAEGLAEMIPWAWGMNGAASVLGSVLSIALAMNLGFNISLLLGLGCYVIGVLVFRTVPRALS